MASLRPIPVINQMAKMSDMRPDDKQPLVEQMRALAVSALARMYRPAERLFAYTLRRTPTGHVLEGVSRHSDRGVMKARWEPADFRAMASRPLPFAAIDVLLIQAAMQHPPAGATSEPLALASTQN